MPRPYRFSAFSNRTDVVHIVHQRHDFIVVEVCNHPHRLRIELSYEDFRMNYNTVPQTQLQWLNAGSLWVPFRETIGQEFARIRYISNNYLHFDQITSEGTSEKKWMTCYAFMLRYCRLWAQVTPPLTPNDIPNINQFRIVQKETLEVAEPELWWVLGSRVKIPEPVCAVFGSRSEAQDYANNYAKLLNISRKRLRVTKKGPFEVSDAKPRKQKKSEPKTLLQHLLD